MSGSSTNLIKHVRVHSRWFFAFDDSSIAIQVAFMSITLNLSPSIARLFVWWLVCAPMATAQDQKQPVIDAPLPPREAARTMVVPTNESEQRATSPLSMMPEGMLQTLTTEQARDLLAYLMGPGQVPLPASASK